MLLIEYLVLNIIFIKQLELHGRQYQQNCIALPGYGPWFVRLKIIPDVTASTIEANFSGGVSYHVSPLRLKHAVPHVYSLYTFIQYTYCIFAITYCI